MAAAAQRRRQIQRNVGIRPERVIIDRANPLEIFTDIELVKRYRFSHESILFITDICINVSRATSRSLPIPPVLAVCSYLRFLATGDLQLTVGDSSGLSQATISRISRQISGILCSKVREYVAFPGDNIADVKQELGRVAGFPNAVGCIDCTHVVISKPSEHPEDYIGRKGKASINVQAICNAKCVITSFNASWPGRTHDSRIWSNSTLRQKFENGTHSGYLLGDSGYGCSRYLLTPILNPANAAEDRYNRVLCRTRVLIEQTFGMFKNRFRILIGKVRAKPSTCVQHITACIVLHNIAIQRREIIHIPDVDFDAPLVPVNIVNDYVDGRAVRAYIIQNYFR